jgi:hypothetical protein
MIAESAGATYHTSSPRDVKEKQDFIYSSNSIKSYWDYSVRLVKQTWNEAAAW